MKGLLAVFLLLGDADAGVIDRVVVVVDDALVMQSDIALEEALAALDPDPSPFWRPTHKDARQRLIDAAIIQQRAGNVNLYVPKNSDVKARVEGIRRSFRSRAAWEAFLDRWGLTEDTLFTVMRRKMVVERYLSRNVQDTPSTDTWIDAVDTLLEELRQSHRIRPITADP